MLSHTQLQREHKSGVYHLSRHWPKSKLKNQLWFLPKLSGTGEDSVKANRSLHIRVWVGGAKRSIFHEAGGASLSKHPHLDVFTLPEHVKHPVLPVKRKSKSPTSIWLVKCWAECQSLLLCECGIWMMSVWEWKGRSDGSAEKKLLFGRTQSIKTKWSQKLSGLKTHMEKCMLL